MKEGMVVITAEEYRSLIADSIKAKALLDAIYEEAEINLGEDNLWFYTHGLSDTLNSVLKAIDPNGWSVTLNTLKAEKEAIRKELEEEVKLDGCACSM